VTLHAVRNAPPAAATPVHEHEFEAAHGLPEPLPADERILWQGAPDWRALAVQALHLRAFGLYFALLLLWQMAGTATSGGGAAGTLLGALPLALLALFALGMLALIGWLMGRTTVYTVTDRRIVMRIGIVLTVTFNLPYRRIDAAALRRRAGGTGDITLTLAGSDRIAWLHLWPHVRPWRLKRAEPMLRALPQAEAVAGIVAAALAAAAGQAQAPRPVVAGRTDSFGPAASAVPSSSQAGPALAA
jgi:hypothetical protein